MPEYVNMTVEVLEASVNQRGLCHFEPNESHCDFTHGTHQILIQCEPTNEAGSPAHRYRCCVPEIDRWKGGVYAKRAYCFHPVGIPITFQNSPLENPDFSLPPLIAAV